jgi:hypothetical protein
VGSLACVTIHEKPVAKGELLLIQPMGLSSKANTRANCVWHELQKEKIRNL